MKTILGATLMLTANAAVAGDVYEIVLTTFKQNISIEEQREEMARLNDVVCLFDGFKSRDYFYSRENGRWVDFVVWTDLAKAKKASEIAMADPVAGAVFAKIDETSSVFSHYDKVGGVKK